jgi:hypothetical protein
MNWIELLNAAAGRDFLLYRGRSRLPSLPWGRQSHAKVYFHVRFASPLQLPFRFRVHLSSRLLRLCLSIRVDVPVYHSNSPWALWKRYLKEPCQCLQVHATFHLTKLTPCRWLT